MSTQTITALVLRAVPYRDYDRILTLFVRGRGAMTAAARASRRLKSPLLNSTAPFVLGEFVLSTKLGRSTVTSCTIDEMHYDLRTDPLKLAYASYLCALCEAAVQPDQPEDALFALLLRALAHVQHSDLSLHATALAFLMHMLDLQGIGPVLDQCSLCGDEASLPRFDAQGAGRVCRACSPAAPLVDPALLMQAQRAREAGFDGAHALSRAAFSLIAGYATAHFDLTFRALAFIERIQPGDPDA